MSVDSRDLYPDLMADEDFQILCAIATNLASRLKLFRVNLPHGAYLSNHASGTNFSFAGIDSIKEAHQKIMELDAQTPHRLVMPTDKITTRIEIGNLFGMKVFVDPNCPKDRFLIEAHQEEEK